MSQALIVGIPGGYKVTGGQSFCVESRNTSVSTVSDVAVAVDAITVALYELSMFWP